MKCYANKTLERDQAYRAVFWESLVQESLHFYWSYLGLSLAPQLPVLY